MLDHVAEGESVDWSGDVFPKLLADGFEPAAKSVEALQSRS